jgi:hypothetical protein
MHGMVNFTISRQLLVRIAEDHENLSKSEIRQRFGVDAFQIHVRNIMFGANLLGAKKRNKIYTCNKRNTTSVAQKKGI